MNRILILLASLFLVGPTHANLIEDFLNWRESLMGMSQRKKKGKVKNYHRPVNKKNTSKNQKRISENNAVLRELAKG